NFQDGVGATMFLLTSQVGDFRLTLTKADRVILVDPAWNPSVDRASRIGQEKDVLVYRIMTCGTVDVITNVRALKVSAAKLRLILLEE
ncbi:protein chromatin remodeling 24, partial [Tanacetum coccineum]